MVQVSPEASPGAFSCLSEPRLEVTELQVTLFYSPLPQQTLFLAFLCRRRRPPPQPNQVDVIFLASGQSG